MKITVLFIYLFVVICKCLVDSLVIPEELPSILSLIYSNIPPIKKGTDSRVGVGFRLGPHADFQVLLELGPQRETAALGPSSSDSKRRRQATPRPHIIMMKKPQDSGQNDIVSDTSAGKWLVSWKSGLLNSQPKYIHLNKDSSSGQVSNEVLSHLQQLYKSKDDNEAES